MQKEANNQSWPPFLAPMRGVLERLRPPEGPFSPNGEWEHRYAVCILGPERQAKAEHVQPYGTLVLKRKPAGDGACTLEVDLLTRARAGSELHTRASLTCAADQLATPRKWELRADIVENGTPAPELSVAETGTVEGGSVLRRGKVQRRMPVRRPFTTNWSLLEALGRMPFEGSEALQFDLIEDLDLFKAGQRLLSVGSVTLDLAGGPLRLHGFRQIGHGVLPVHYWLDDQHRLLVSSGSLRGLIWDPDGSLTRKGKS